VVAALRKVYETSEAVQLSAAASRSVRLADEFQHLAGPFGSFGGERIVTIAPAKSEKAAEARLILDDGQREPMIIGPLALDLFPRAHGEMRLANLRRRQPALVRFDVRAEAGGPEIDFTYEPASRNVEDLRTFARLADQLRTIVRTGRLESTWTALEITATITNRGTLEVLLQGEACSLRLEFDGIEYLGETAVPLGRAAFNCVSARLADPAAARAQLDVVLENVTLLFVPGDADLLERCYPDWGPQRQRSSRAYRQHRRPYDRDDGPMIGIWRDYDDFQRQRT
jgi:hypothetical protein